MGKFIVSGYREIVIDERNAGEGEVNVPAHLRRFVVEQDYSRYDAMDRAVWRFLLLQTQARLVETAHPVYREGLAATGISVDHIPSVVEMNAKLSRFGWGAVCVDGFIPPRAFQEFQASGILPISADVRSREHLAYTPAPDIFHEAAGHAPILPDPVFSAYVRRMGDLGKKAFTLPDEDRLYEAIHALSEKKEDPSLGADELARAEAELKTVIDSLPEPSEAARLSRLYWWTAEYGLVGRVDDYKLYGAGLLSSLGESHSCHAPTVTKRPLDEGCVEVSYDITRPQPQLFVAASFEQLHEVLDRVARNLAVTMGGEVALGRAVASRELASVAFSSGAVVMGVLTERGPALSHPSWLAFDGRVAFAWEGAMLPEQRRLGHVDGHLVVTGRLADGRALEHIDDGAIHSARDPQTGRSTFVFATGARVEGHWERSVRHADGRLVHIELGDARVTVADRPPYTTPRYVLLSAGDPVGAHAGAVDPAYHPPTATSGVRVPKPRVLPENARRLLSLYQQAERAHNRGSDAMKSEFPRVHAALMRDQPRDQPDEWLLRWNLLESLLKVRDDGALTRTLRAELEALEIAFDHKQPIASGLDYLARRSERPGRKIA